ncbi:hypothetical protein [Myceligenerans xiligouense]|uniref:Uncharacterized protein n=1 Tax=Myceligenerans xiligouense TaxID=253184 RepID=A0A3N4ZN70_9MICO|nr:hypothetical protein [Myceligenerans xiligouense]RPF21321.1 hypothetical protein EDD34_1948 [Myceligenerans xiligouense]
MIVDGPGWVDGSTNPIRGLFPLAVEQYLNAAVSVNAPGVTTVTTTARYYALHPLVVDEAKRRRLDTPGMRRLLRRVEVAYALICMAHHGQPGHHSWYPAPHGRDRLLTALSHGPVDLAVAAGTEAGRYAKAATGFLGPYVGSETGLGLLAQGALAPGPAYDHTIVHGALGAVLDLAAASRLGLDDVRDHAALCLCQAVTSADGELLAGRFAGRPDEIGTVAGNLGQVMRLFATAMEQAEIRSRADLGRFVMFDPAVTEHPHSTDNWLRWRGIRLRAMSVTAWRDLFAYLCRYLNEGPMTIAQLGECLAEELPSGTLGDFLDALPPAVDDKGAPLPAENEIAAWPAPRRHLATILLGAQRFEALTDINGPVRLGFVGPPGRRSEKEELAPRWVHDVIADRRTQSLRDFAIWLARVMINRAHRATLAKSRYQRDGRFTMPLRVLVQDDLVIRVHGVATGEPPLRWAQLLSMGRQTGIFQTGVDGRWEVGPRGGLLG